MPAQRLRKFTLVKRVRKLVFHRHEAGRLGDGEAFHERPLGEQQARLAAN
jgi:hypothetical protein